jgi:hypothetical protein
MRPARERDLTHRPAKPRIHRFATRPGDGSPVTSQGEPIDAGTERRLAVVRNAYVAAVNAALDNGRDRLAEELAAEYEAEYLRPSRERDGAAA